MTVERYVGAPGRFLHFLPFPYSSNKPCIPQSLTTKKKTIKNSNHDAYCVLNQEKRTQPINPSFTTFPIEIKLFTDRCEI